MDRFSVKEFVKELLGPNIVIKDIGEWVSIRCPFAPWTHTKGTDSKPSFGIKANNYDHSVYNCLTCKERGVLENLPSRLATYTGEDYKQITESIKDQEFLGGTLPEWGDRKSYDTKYAPLGEPLDETYLHIYDSAVGHWYLKDRGIDDDTAEALDLRLDEEDNHGAERILFPVHSPDGGFYGYSGRATDNSVDPRIRDYAGLPKRHLLLGAERIPSDAKFIVLVEGLFDYARLKMYDAPVVASMHADVTPPQADILKEIGLPIYVIYDNDQAGRKGREKVKIALGKHLPLNKVRYPKRFERNEGDPGKLRENEYKKMLKTSRLL